MLDIAMLMPSLFLMMFVLYDIFDLFDSNINDGIQIFISLIIASVIGNALLVVVAFGFNIVDLPAKLFIYALIIQVIIILPIKLLYEAWYKKNYPPKRLLVIAGDDEIRRMMQIIEIKAKQQYSILQIASSMDAVEGAVLSQMEGVFLGNDIPQEERTSVIQTCIRMHIPAFFMPDLMQICLRKAHLVHIDDALMFRIDSYVMSMEEKFIKRLMDVSISVLTLVLVLPLLLIVSLLIKMEDGGAVLFRQERVKKDEAAFSLLKFRTMKMDAERDLGPVLSTSKDPRITKIGNMLRKTRIDELPQLINVLQGDMTLIGPRPERPFFVEEYKKSIKNYTERFRVKPGITGLAQVEGKYSSNVEDKLTYDLLYILNYDLLLDIKIIIQTIRVILSPESAAGIKEDE
jgi:exopolysaccharide biosynthesis polyprenyl glycosylphosphotransferase